MTSKERMLRALNREVPDRLPVTVHQWQKYHLDKYMGGIDDLAACRQCGLDAAIAYFEAIGQFWMPEAAAPADLSPHWHDEITVVKDDPDDTIVHHTITTPDGTLTYKTGGNRMTIWITEYLIKKPEDVDLIEKYMPVPRLNQQSITAAYDRLGDDGILRGFVWGDQAGSWQHACCLHGEMPMIYAAMDDPAWVHRLMQVLTEKKLRFVEESLDGAKFDLIETGGGAGSSTVISPKMHEEFCVPYDRQVHDACHAVGQKVVYHTCGGMMPLLEMIVANGCDASETLSCPDVGGDVSDIGEAKRRIGDKVCLIGGMNQFQILTEGTPEQVRAEVRRLFEAAGQGGSYICSTSDHFFESPPENLQAMGDAAKECIY
jgi:uroporphyrinogen-III decarboxylase